MKAHIDFEPIEDCRNPDSYGMICVKCNRCERFGETTTENAIISILKSKNKKEAGERFRHIMIHYRDKVNWRAINEAIMDRWSYSGLIDIKNNAWKDSEEV